MTGEDESSLTDYIYADVITSLFVCVCLQSLVHVLKQRKTLTEPEVRFYLTQLVSGTRYIHSQRIIHRDLKLSNMLLNEAMHVKMSPQYGSGSD